MEVRVRTGQNIGYGGGGQMSLTLKKTAPSGTNSTSTRSTARRSASWPLAARGARRGRRTRPVEASGDGTEAYPLACWSNARAELKPDIELASQFAIRNFALALRPHIG